MDSESTDVAYALVRDNLTSVPQFAERHIEYEELAAYVDGHLDANKRDAIAAHVKSCTDCETEVAEFLRLSEAIASDEKAVAALPREAASFWQRPAFRIGLEALAVVLIILGAVWFSTREIKSLRDENELLRKSVSESEAVIAELQHQVDSLARAGSGGFTNEPEITVKLKDGNNLVTIDSNGTLGGLDSFNDEYRQMVKKALETGRVSVSPVIAALRGSYETIMKGNADGPGFRLLRPVGIVVETNRPTFKWTKLTGALDYQVTVIDDRGEVIQKKSVSGDSRQLVIPLPRGKVYQWQVRATDRDGHEVKSPAVGQPDAKLSVLSQNELGELEQARRADPSSHLVLGALYAKAGLIKEAKRELRALLVANPESQVAKRILSSLNNK